MREDLLHYLTEFVSFQSVHGNAEQKTACLDWIADTFLSAHSQQIQRGSVDDSPYVYLHHVEPELCWFAHTDVVPGTPEQFSVTVDEDKAYGRGVKDMKGAALPFLLAYKHATERGEKPRVSILLTSDEETAGKSIPHLLQSGVLQPPVAFTPDTSTHPGIVVEHKGVVWAELTVRGKGGHGAMPWECENPLWKLSEALQILQKQFPPGTYDDWQITVTPTTLAGSGARNQVPDTARCGLDIRYPASLCASANEALAVVSSVLPAECILKETVSASPLQTDSNHHMVQRIQSIAQRIEGRDIELIREHGGTDARFFSEAGIPAFLYGPVGGDLHGANEWVSVSSLLHQYHISAALLSSLL